MSEQKPKAQETETKEADKMIIDQKQLEMIKEMLEKDNKEKQLKKEKELEERAEKIRQAEKK